MATNNCKVANLSLKVYSSRIDLWSPVVKLAHLLPGVRLCIAARPAGICSSNWQHPGEGLGVLFPAGI